MKPERSTGGRIAVALSGGVDSAVTAALLKQDGWDVFGLTMRLTDDDAVTRDAARVAEALDVPHETLDLRRAFRERVLEPFSRAYADGLTPSPCTLCNRDVKLGALVRAAIDRGASGLATGHYACVEIGPDGPRLRRAVDLGRDQSYFLFAVRREIWPFVRFPLGDMPGKAETRRLAGTFGLPVEEKADSQDLCFAAKGRHGDVVRAFVTTADQAGDVVDEQGRRVGRHAGLFNYTIGQRRGLGLGGAGEALYVTRLERSEAGGRVVVGPKESLKRSVFEVGGLNWLGDGDAPPDRDFRVRVKIRNLSPQAEATVRACVQTGTARVETDAPLSAVAPGQAAVFYDPETGDRVLAGGWIRR